MDTTLNPAIQEIEATEKAPTLREHAGDACLRLACVISGALGLMPSTAYAQVDVSNTLTEVLNMLANGVTLLGGILVVMGLVNLGLALKDGAQGGGQLSGALAMIVGGMVVVGAGAYFRTFDTNLAG